MLIHVELLCQERAVSAAGAASLVAPRPPPQPLARIHSAASLLPDDTHFVKATFV